MMSKPRVSGQLSNYTGCPEAGDWWHVVSHKQRPAQSVHTSVRVTDAGAQKFENVRSQFREVMVNYV